MGKILGASLDMQQVAASTTLMTPAAGYTKCYIRDDGRLYIKDSSGTERQISSPTAGAGLAYTQATDVFSIGAGAVTSNMIKDNEIQLGDLSASGTKDATTFLRGDNTWAVPPGTGGGLSDGDKGEITVASGGTQWTIDAGVVTFAKMAADTKDQAAGTASMRTLSTTGTSACAGNDSRLSNSRTPTGAAGGDIGGTYPSSITVNQSTGAFTVGTNLTVNGTISSGSQVTQQLVLSNNTINFSSPANVAIRIGMAITGSSLAFRQTMITAGTDSYNSAAATAANTVTFNANDIHSWANGIFMEDLAGGGSTTATIGNGGRLTRTSSVTMKEDVEPMTWEEARSVLGLNSYTFRFRQDSDQSPNDPRRYPGFIAEQAAEAGAELWVGRQHQVERDEETGEATFTRDKEGPIIYFRTAEITVAHNELIKDLYARIEELEGKLAS